MSKITAILSELPTAATVRVLDYLNRRYLPGPTCAGEDKRDPNA